LTPRHGAPPGLPQIMVKLLPMSPDRSVTYVSRLYHSRSNNALQPTAQPLRGFASAELHR
jgi:hypothetical protein